jgi:hypothetical protein
MFLCIISEEQDILNAYTNLFTPVEKYAVYQTISKIFIDGKGDETSWQNAEWSPYFTDLIKKDNPVPFYKTRFKMLWDKMYLYILIEVEDPQIWTYFVSRDQEVYNENTVAVLLDPNRDTHYYYEFDVNAQNTIFDQYQTKPPRNGGRARRDWDIKGLKSATNVLGTLNNPTDIDEKWTVEFAVPFKSLSANGSYYKPKNREFWKLNLLRVHWKTDIVDGRYVKTGENGPNWKTGLNEYYRNADVWSWSAQGIANMLYPERWGLIRFYQESVSVEKEIFELPDEEIFAKYLWAIYYRQNKYNLQTLHNADTLSELGIPQVLTVENGDKVFLNMKVWGSSYLVTLQNQEGLKLSVNQDGEFLILNNPTED